jgi:hypothetical protein
VRSTGDDLATSSTRPSIEADAVAKLKVYLLA